MALLTNYSRSCLTGPSFSRMSLVGLGFVANCMFLVLSSVIHFLMCWDFIRRLRVGSHHSMFCVSMARRQNENVSRMASGMKNSALISASLPTRLLLLRTVGSKHGDGHIVS